MVRELEQAFTQKRMLNSLTKTSNCFTAQLCAVCVPHKEEWHRLYLPVSQLFRR